MTTVPLGTSAYRRLYGGEPEIILLNRWLERNPTNLREHTTLLARPATTPLLSFSPGAYPATPPLRGLYAPGGLFNGAIFVVCGDTLFMVNQDLTSIQVGNVLAGTDTPEFAWMEGPGYQTLFIESGGSLAYYSGPAYATGTLTGTFTTQTIKLGSQYYTGVTSVTGGLGTSANPWQVVTTGGDPFANLVNAVVASGVPGVTYSAGILTPNPALAAQGDGNSPVVTVHMTATAPGTPGNSVATTVVAGGALTFSATTLTSGASGSLNPVTLPTGVTISSLTQVKGYVLAASRGTQQFYWINPGEHVIDPLNFASKESSPDPIVSLRTVGDQALVMGSKSTENWYATGVINAPFAPLEGRTYQRGVIAGTPCVIGDAVVFVGDDLRVYSVGYQYSNEDIAGGIKPLSDNSIDERIRRQLRRQAGLTP